MFQFGSAPAKNKPSRVTNKATSATDYIITNSIFKGATKSY